MKIGKQIKKLKCPRWYLGTIPCARCPPFILLNPFSILLLPALCPSRLTYMDCINQLPCPPLTRPSSSSVSSKGTVSSRPGLLWSPVFHTSHSTGT